MPLKLQVPCPWTTAACSRSRVALASLEAPAVSASAYHIASLDLWLGLANSTYNVLQGSRSSLGTSTVLRVEKASQEFVFEDVYARPVPSLLRNFSAPVKMEVVDQSEADLAHILAYDTDPFNRWDSAQRLARNVLLKLYEQQARQQVRQP